MARKRDMRHTFSVDVTGAAGYQARFDDVQDGLRTASVFARWDLERLGGGEVDVTVTDMRDGQALSAHVAVKR